MKLTLLAARNNIHTVRWVNALCGRGHAVSLITMHAPTEPLAPGVAVYELPLSARLGYFMNLFHLRQLLRAIKPDILHAHYASGYGTLGRLGGFHPYVLSVWGADVYDFPKASPLHRRLVAANLQSADWVCSTSQVMATHTRDLCPTLKHLSVTPFGIDPERFSPQPQLRNRDTITVGTVKVLHSKYGIDTLIRGFTRCRRLLAAEGDRLAERLRLRITGSGPQRRELENLADKLGVAEVTEFVGKVPHSEVPSQLNQLDIYVAVSRRDSESFGVAVLEASACGLPVVVSDAGGLPEVVVDGKTGWVVPRENPQALAEALRRLIIEPGLRGQSGSAGRQHVIDNYEWRGNVLQMEEVYRQVRQGQKTDSPSKSRRAA